MKNKIGILLNCRLESRRLPNKALIKICGKFLIEHIILRLKRNKITKKIILCIPKNKKNNSLVEIAKKNKILFYRGSYNDVLRRVYEGAKKNNVELMIVTGGDNPLVDINYLEKIAKFHKKKNNDFSKIYGLPWGSFCYAVSIKSVEKVLKIKKTTYTENWPLYFTKNKIFKCGTLIVKEKKLFFPKLRLTIDTLTDLKLFTVLFNVFYKKNKAISLKKVISFCRKNKEVFKINSNIVQKKPIQPIF